MGLLVKKPHKSDPRDRGQRVCVDPARLLSLAKPRPTQSAVRGYITARSKEMTKNGEFLKYSAKKKHVVIPSGIKTIGRSAFSGELITSVTFPGTVKKIDKGAFFRCRNLKSVEIPDSVTKIGECAFANCYNLESVILPAGIHSRHGDVYR